MSTDEVAEIRRIHQTCGYAPRAAVLFAHIDALTAELSCERIKRATAERSEELLQARLAAQREEPHMSTDYTEEDVERVAQFFFDRQPDYSAPGSERPVWAWANYRNNPKQVEAMELARAALDVIHPLAYTAGALAMKEAAADQCDGMGRVWSKFHAPMASTAMNLADHIRALPVPPRGSKI